MGNGEVEDKAAPSGCCLVSLFWHPCRSRPSVAACDILLIEPPRLVVSSNSSGSTHGDDDKAQLMLPSDSSGGNAKAGAASVSMENAQCESDKASLLVPAVPLKPPIEPYSNLHKAAAKNQARGLPPPPQLQEDPATRKHPKRRSLGGLSSSNVMIFANLGNLRRKKSSSIGASPGHDELDYLSEVAQEPKAGAEKGNDEDQFEGLGAEELKEMGNEEYKKGKYADAVALYDMAIKRDPGKASYWSNKAAALIGLGRLLEAVWEFREAVRIDPSYCKAHYRLAVLYTRLGDAEKAIYHYKLAQDEASSEDLSRAQALQSHLANCDEARTCRNWPALLKQTQIAVSIGADSSPRVFASKAEALLNLHRHEEANAAMTSAPKFDADVSAKYFGAADTARFLAVQAQVDLAAGRFEDAVAAARKASVLDTDTDDSSSSSSLVAKAAAMASSRSIGDGLFMASRFEEACSAYGEGLVHDPYNAILLCNRAACLLKLGEWEKVVEACSTALKIRPFYNKARLRRADCNAKLERWAAAIEDYEFLLHEMPGDEEVVKALFEAHVQLEKQQGGAKDSNHGAGSLELIATKEQFWQTVMLPGLSVALFFRKSSETSRNSVPPTDQLSKQFPSVNFFQVDVEESSGLAKSENINSVPVFKIYKNGLNVKEIMVSDLKELESSIRSFSP